MTLAVTDPPRISFVAEIFRREPRLAANALFYLLLCLPLLFAAMVDQRTVADVNVWVKPLKFCISISTWLAAFAWIHGWLPEEQRRARWLSWLIVAALICSAAEIAWITGASAFGIASHFNTATPLMAIAYGVAGVAVMVVMALAPAYAWALRKAALPAPFKLSLIVGMALSFVLTVWVASYMASQPSHFVGGDLSDAQGMMVTGWARDGGDLRPAHFFALHAMHVIPLVGWLAAMMLSVGRAIAAVGLTSAVYALFTVYTFFEALAGRPFMPFL